MFLGKYEEIIVYYDNYFVAKKHPSGWEISEIVFNHMNMHNFDISTDYQACVYC